MRIGTQNILFILPLFLVLAGVLGGTLYLREDSERLWGQQQQASCYAISIAEFVNERMADANSANYSPTTDPGLKRALVRILGDRRVKTVFALSPDAKSVTWSYPAGSVTSVPPWTPPHLPSMMREGPYGGVWTSPLTKTGHNTGVMEAYSSMLTPDKTLVGSIGVVTDASEYLRQTNQIWTSVVIAAIIVTAIGLLVTLLVSSLISREVRNLSTTAALISGGNLDVLATPGHIQEIGDLGNTFNTMSDVLKDVLSRTKRSLTEGEQFRTPAELAAAYVDMFRPPIAEEINGIRIAGRTTGQDFGAFWTTVETQDGCCVVLGQLTAEDDVATAIAASATTRFLKHRLTKDDTKAALAEAIELFHPDFIECLCFGKASVDHWTMGATASTKVTGQSNTDDGLLTVQSYPYEARNRWVLYRIEPDTGSIVERYMDVFGGHSVDDLVNDLANALPSGSRGALIVAGKVAHSK